MKTKKSQKWDIWYVCILSIEMKIVWGGMFSLAQYQRTPTATQCTALWDTLGVQMDINLTLHFYTTGCVLTLPFPWRLREGFNLRKIKVLIFSFCCTDFAGAKYALCPPDHSLCAAANWQFIWEMWQIYLGAKHLLRLYICRVMMPENKGNWMELYL